MFSDQTLVWTTVLINQNYPLTVRCTALRPLACFDLTGNENVSFDNSVFVSELWVQSLSPTPSEFCSCSSDWSVSFGHFSVMHSYPQNSSLLLVCMDIHSAVSLTMLMALCCKRQSDSCRSELWFVCVDIKTTRSHTGTYFDLLPCSLSTIPSRSRLHPSTSDLRHGHRLHLSVLEHRLWREGSLHAVRQRGLQASVRQHRHRAEVVSLHPVHHHVAVSEEELQEIHQEQRGVPDAHRTLRLQCDSGQFGQGDHPEPSQQDKVHIQPGGPRDVRQHGVSFIVVVWTGTAGLELRLFMCNWSDVRCFFGVVSV